MKSVLLYGKQRFCLLETVLFVGNSVFVMKFAFLLCKLGLHNRNCISVLETAFRTQSCVYVLEIAFRIGNIGEQYMPP